MKYNCKLGKIKCYHENSFAASLYDGLSFPGKGRQFAIVYVSDILEGVLGFCIVCGAGERQPPAVFFPEPHLFRPLGVTVGCNGNTVLARGRLRQKVVQAHF